MTIVLGLDPGTANPALAVLERTERRWTLLRSPVLHSLDDLLDQLTDIGRSDHCPDLVVVESVDWALGASHKAGRHGNGSTRILESVGAVRMFAAQYAIPVEIVRPQSWRLTIAGSAKATKPAVRRALERVITNWPRGVVGLNRSDAMAIAIAGAMRAPRNLFAT